MRVAYPVGRLLIPLRPEPFWLVCKLRSQSTIGPQLDFRCKHFSHVTSSPNSSNQPVDVCPVDLYVEADVPVPVSQPEWLRWFESWLQAMQVFGPSELTLTLTDDERMQGLNRQYRDRDATTDVLAFAAQEAAMPGNSEGRPLVLGDIVISVPTAQRQADEQQHPLSEELAWLASHGLLHLLGWDHPDDESLQQMLQKQRDLLNHARE